MKIRNPIYLALALSLAGYVALANHNGWSLMESLTPRAWSATAPSTQHK